MSLRREAQNLFVHASACYNSDADPILTFPNVLSAIRSNIGGAWLILTHFPVRSEKPLQLQGLVSMQTLKCYNQKKLHRPVPKRQGCNRIAVAKSGTVPIFCGDMKRKLQTGLETKSKCATKVHRFEIVV